MIDINRTEETCQRDAQIPLASKKVITQLGQSFRQNTVEYKAEQIEH